MSLWQNPPPPPGPHPPPPPPPPIPYAFGRGETLMKDGLSWDLAQANAEMKRREWEIEQGLPTLLRIK